MNGLGIEGILAVAAMAHPYRILVAPHNWSSLLGLYQQVHVGVVIPNFYRAEHDPLESDVLIAEGYKIEDGLCSVPDAPGFGLAIDEKRFANVRLLFDLTM
jgi:L-alanine-DL-glutamate epimerase-like enolase superfamily enzyme